jgi:hypothetical protein
MGQKASKSLNAGAATGADKLQKTRFAWLFQLLTQQSNRKFISKNEKQQVFRVL